MISCLDTIRNLELVSDMQMMAAFVNELFNFSTIILLLLFDEQHVSSLSS